MKDTTCKDDKNHAVTMVGYTDRFILIKNSWGRNWGDRGFLRLARNHHNCFLYPSSYYPVLRKTGRRDANPDPIVYYRPPMGPEKACYDNDPSFCRQFRGNEGEDPQCLWVSYLMYYIMANCKRTCKLCDRNNGNDKGGKCPGGTVRCSDG